MVSVAPLAVAVRDADIDVASMEGPESIARVTQWKVCLAMRR